MDFLVMAIMVVWFGMMPAIAMFIYFIITGKI